MLVRLEPRSAPWPRMAYLSPLIAIGLMLLLGTLMFSVLGQPPLAAFHAFFIEPINDLYGIGELVIKASPLALIALGLAVGFRANIWNIGAEGQLLIGAIAGTVVALYCQDVDSILVLPAMFIAGALGGLLWAAIPAYLKIKFDANEILVSLMLVYIAGFLLSYLLYGPLRDPDGFGFPQSPLLGDAAMLPTIMAGTRMHAGVYLTLLAVVAYAIFCKWSLLAFQMRVGGLAKKASTYAGFSLNKTIMVGLLSGGTAAGIAGVAEVAGPSGQLLEPVSPGYGFAAIIVAFVGRLAPSGILLASLLVSLLYLGGESAQLHLSIPTSVSGVFQGLLLFLLLATDVLINFKIRFGAN